MNSIALTDEAVVPCHVGPSLGRIDVVMEVHRLVCLEFAAWCKGRGLQVDPQACVIFLAVLSAPALLLLLLLPVFGVDGLDGKWTFCPVVELGFGPRPLARGCHGWRVIEVVGEGGGTKKDTGSGSRPCGGWDGGTGV